jgi:hypothetical protein
MIGVRVRRLRALDADGVGADRLHERENGSRTVNGCDFRNNTKSCNYNEKRNA